MGYGMGWQDHYFKRKNNQLETHLAEREGVNQPRKIIDLDWLTFKFRSTVL
jgi:hypothetical protein